MQEENLEFKNIFESVTDPESAKIMKSLSDKLIKAREELEALRASHAKLIAERDCIEATSRYNYDLAMKATKERDALLAEREAVKSDLDMCKLCADSYEDELKKMHAEREAMMKQEPIYQWNNTNDKTLWVDCNKDVYDIMRDEHRRIVYRSPLPAQQINPKVEAYLFKCRKGGERMEYVCVDPDNTQYKRDKHELIEVLPLGVIEPAQQIPEGINIDDIIDLIVGYEIKIEGEWGACRGIDELIKEGHMPDIYYKLLSASQPKGDV